MASASSSRRVGILGLPPDIVAAVLLPNIDLHTKITQLSRLCHIFPTALPTSFRHDHLALNLSALHQSDPRYPSCLLPLLSGARSLWLPADSCTAECDRLRLHDKQRSAAGQELHEHAVVDLLRDSIQLHVTCLRRFTCVTSLHLALPHAHFGPVSGGLLADLFASVDCFPALVSLALELGADTPHKHNHRLHPATVFSAADALHLGCLPLLAQLRLSGSSVDVHTVQALQSLPSLVQLDLAECYCDVLLKVNQAIESYGTSSTLRSVRLPHMRYAHSPDAWLQWSNNALLWTNLTHLDVSDQLGFSSPTALATITSFTGLTSLHTEHANMSLFRCLVTETQQPALPQLRSFVSRTSVHSIYKSVQAALTFVHVYSSQLRTVQILFAKSVYDSVLLLHAALLCVQLRELTFRLSLEEGSGLQSNGPLMIARRLHTLRLQQNAPYLARARDLQALLSVMPALRHLHLQGMFGFDVLGMVGLHARALVTLSLDH